MIKRAALTIIGLWSTIAVASTLYLLDQIVHGTLYNYGLQFNYNWANPYWLLLRIIQVLLAINIITTIAGLAFALRSPSKTEKQRTKAAPIPRATKPIPMATHNDEKPRPTSAPSQPLPSPATTLSRQRPAQQPDSRLTSTHQLSTPSTQTTPTASYKPSSSNGLVTCPNCGKSFTQPLRMLNFQGDTPRIVDTCPFCSETIPHASRGQEREQDQNNRFPTTRNNHNHQRTITQ